MKAERKAWSRRRLLGAAGLSAAGFFVPAGCGSSSRLSVFAATSLTEAFTEVGAAFSRAHGRAPAFNFAASSVLATQLLEGAPADVFASADEPQISRLLEARKIGEPRIIATNVTAVITTKQGGLTSFSGLSRPGLRIVLAAPAVPAGHYAREVLDRAADDPAFGPGFRDAVLANIRSEELSARAVLAKVELGEADAGFVFSTDARVASGELVTVSIPQTISVLASYPAAVILDTKRAALAEAFINFVISPAGQAILAAWGFGPGEERS